MDAQQSPIARLIALKGDLEELRAHIDQERRKLKPQRVYAEGTDSHEKAVAEHAAYVDNVSDTLSSLEQDWEHAGLLMYHEEVDVAHAHRLVDTLNDQAQRVSSELDQLNHLTNSDAIVLPATSTESASPTSATNTGVQEPIRMDVIRQPAPNSEQESEWATQLRRDFENLREHIDSLHIEELSKRLNNLPEAQLNALRRFTPIELREAFTNISLLTDDDIQSLREILHTYRHVPPDRREEAFRWPLSIGSGLARLTHKSDKNGKSGKHAG